ncbi:MAG: hypothetical protein J5627_02010, partial [Bacilli bacterium]|nr:hypothetical protein [Bacilli bacterium]
MIEEKNENQETEEIEKVEPESEEIETPIDEVTSEEITQSRFGPEDLEAAIKTRDRKALSEIFETIPDADIAEAAEEIDIKELITLFRYAKPSMTAPLFAELSQDKKEELVTAMSDRELIAMINEQYADDVADTVDDMPSNLARRVLKAASPDM